MLPGGEWAWQELKGQTPALDEEDIVLIGARDASAECGVLSGGWCEIYATLDHSVVRIQFGYYYSYDGEEREVVDSTPRAMQLMRYVLSQLKH
jgi:hypothetical protein